MKKLYRSATHRVVAGVMGGLGEYFALDPVMLRLLYVFATVFTGLVPGILAYLLAILIVPPQPFAKVRHDEPEA